MAVVSEDLCSFVGRFWPISGRAWIDVERLGDPCHMMDQRRTPDSANA